MVSQTNSLSLLVAQRGDVDVIASKKESKNKHSTFFDWSVFDVQNCFLRKKTLTLPAHDFCIVKN